LAPRLGVASGSPVAVSAACTSDDSGMPVAAPVASSMLMVSWPLASVGSKM